MIDLLKTIYNFAEPVRVRKGYRSTYELVEIRRDKILDLTKKKPMKTADIATKINYDIRLVRADIRKLVGDGKLINLSRDKEYYVKAA